MADVYVRKGILHLRDTKFKVLNDCVGSFLPAHHHTNATTKGLLFLSMKVLFPRVKCLKATFFKIAISGSRFNVTHARNTEGWYMVFEE